MFNCNLGYFSLTKFVYDKKSIFDILYQTKFSMKKMFTVLNLNSKKYQKDGKRSELRKSQRRKPNRTPKTP
jgi:hypothetical protein